MSDAGQRVRELTEPSSSAERLCGGFIKRASTDFGSAYAWCRRALKPPPPAAANGIVTGLSFGVNACDEWSLALSQWFGVRSVLFDCFASRSDFAAELQRFAVPPLRLDRCLAGSSPPRRQFVDWPAALKAAGMSAAPQHGLVAKLESAAPTRTNRRMSCSSNPWPACTFPLAASRGANGARCAR
eukprot:5261704-Prymnesium_polylepis.2